MPDINLDKRRASLKPSTITANGHRYKLPTYMPAAIMETSLALINIESDPGAAVHGTHDMYVALFGESRAAEAMRDIGLNELQQIVAEVYNVTPGEVPASVSSSSTNGTRSRRTSRVSTKST